MTIATPAQITRFLVVQGLIAAAFLLLALISLQLGVQPILSRPLWLPAGLLAALVLSRGSHDALGLALGAGLFGLWRYSDSQGLASLLANSASVLVQVYLGAYLLRVWGSAQLSELWRTRDLLVSAVVLGPIMMALKPLLLFPFLRYAELIPSHNLFDRALDWIVVDLMAAFIVGPVFLVWVGRPRAWWRARARALVFGQALIVVAFVTALQTVASFEGRRLRLVLAAELGFRVERLLVQLEPVEQLSTQPDKAAARADLPVANFDLARWEAREHAFFANKGWYFEVSKAALPVAPWALRIDQAVQVGGQSFTASIALSELAVRALVSRNLWWFQLAFSCAALLGTAISLNASTRQRVLERRVQERTAELEASTRELRLFKALSDQATDAIVVSLPTSERAKQPLLVYANQAFCELTGYSAEEIVNNASFSLRGPDSDAAGPREVLASLRQGKAASMEAYHYRRDGTRYLAQFSAFPISDQVGVVSHWAGVYRDLSQQRARELGELARERHDHERARHEQMGRMAGGVAHDFNNLLTAVLGSVELLRMERPQHTEGEEELLRAIEQAVQSGADMTHQLLAFAGRGQGRMDRIDLVERVRSMQKMLSLTIDAEVKLSFELPEQSLHICMDPAWLAQIVLNLVVNAAQARCAPEHQVCVAIYDSPGAAPGLLTRVRAEHLRAERYHCLLVRDTGAGIAEQLLPHIFEAFFTTKASGTGLGLAAVAGVIRQSGAWLNVHSVVGEGTQVEIFLPADTSESAVSNLPQATAQLSRSVSVLVVEDEPTLLAYVTCVLQSAHMRVQQASDAQQARALCLDHAFDLVLSDLIMPGVGGVEFIRWLSEQTRRVPVVVMTGYAPSEADALRGPASPVVATLQKPFSAANLLRVVNNALAAQS